MAVNRSFPCKFMGKLSSKSVQEEKEENVNGNNNDEYFEMLEAPVSKNRDRRISNLMVNEKHRTTPYVKASDLEHFIQMEKEGEYKQLHML